MYQPAAKLNNFLEMSLVRETASSLTFTIPDCPAVRFIHLNNITGLITIRTDQFFFTCTLSGDQISIGSFRWVDPMDETVSMNPPSDF